ncbi:MAG: VOC family protein [Actinobacteria bacterium]|nr:VOC family protein [Actinomycetota bacterium]
MPTISHMLWFDDKAEEAANFYVSIFPDAKVQGISRGPDGKAFTVNFEILGENYIALNGGPIFTFSEAISIFVNCDGQAEVDKYWDAFIEAGGSEGRCGWLKDKYGLSWQIIPKQLGEALSNSDPLKSQASMAAMMKMSKIIISDL